MIARLLLFSLGYATMLAIPIYAVKRAMNPWLEERKKLKNARKRSAIITHKDKTCCLCLDPVDTLTDCYEDSYQWYHAECMKKIRG